MDVGDILTFKPVTAPKRPAAGEEREEEEEVEDDDPNDSYEKRAAKRRKRNKVRFGDVIVQGCVTTF